MEGLGGLGISDVSSSVRKKRSSTSRRPRNESLAPLDNRGNSSVSDLSKGSSDDDENVYGSASRKKEINVNAAESAIAKNVTKNKDGGFMDSDEASNNGSYRGSNEEKHGSVKRVKIQVGGVPRMLRNQSVSDDASAVGSSNSKASRVSDALRPNRKFKQGPDEPRSFTSYNELEKANSVGPDEDVDANDTEKYEPVRKSKRISKKRLMEDVLDDGYDHPAEYLEKHGSSRVSRGYSVEVRPRKISNADHGEQSGDCGSSRSRKEAKKVELILDDSDYEGEEVDELVSEDELDYKKRKPKRGFTEAIVDLKNEMMVTTRQRALQTGKDTASSVATTLIEFPTGLPTATTRKQKEKLSEVEQQLKKAEAAKRRRVQVEKAARESEAEAIRKILGQDSSRKKREDKIRKQREDLAQERAANSMIIPSDSVRWVMGPSGTTVTFPDAMGLPTIFDSKPCSYPPPREKCAGPSCKNPYKYRDSESKLPLCSLRCYKAIHENTTPLTAVPIK